MAVKNSTYPPRAMETRVMETFAKISGNAQFCHEVAHWKLYRVMETFAVPLEGFQCAHEDPFAQWELI